MDKPLAIVTGIAIGGGLMYLFDPDCGKRRRVLIRDKTVSTVREVDDAISKASRDLSNRARGFIAEARSLVSSEEIPDDVLKARVETKIGRLATHHHGIDVESDDGNITLRGPVLSSEVQALIRGVSAMSGVRSVCNRLEVHETAEDIPGLQGMPRRPGRRAELFQPNLPPGTRLIVAVAAGALALYGATHRNWLGAGATALGIALLARGIANSEASSSAGIDRAA
jgi:hypothetical protein